MAFLGRNRCLAIRTESNPFERLLLRSTRSCEPVKSLDLDFFAPEVFLWLKVINYVRKGYGIEELAGWPNVLSRINIPLRTFVIRGFSNVDCVGIGFADAAPAPSTRTLTAHAGNVDWN